MNGLDLGIVLATVCAGWAGWRIGLLARVLSWAGLLGGLFIGARVAPPLFERSAGSDATRIALLGLVLLGAALVGKWLGLALGKAVHRRLPARPLRTADRIAGGLLGILGVVVLTWVLVPLAGVLPGWPAEQTRRSTVARFVHRSLPAPPAALSSLRHLVAGARFPQVSDLWDPTPDGASDLTTPHPVDAADKTRQVPVSGDIGEVASDAAVLVRSAGCPLVSEGSGVAVGSDRIITNAHVVAGASSIEVEDSDGSRRSAALVAFDPVIDLALLHVGSLTASSVLLGVPRRNTPVAIAGHPRGGALRVAAGMVLRRVTRSGFDIYDRGRATRDVLVMSARLLPGDSGAGVLDSGGRLVGVAFAVAPDDPGIAYAVTAADLRRFLSAAPPEAPLGTPRPAGQSAVSAGRCLGHD